MMTSRSNRQEIRSSGVDLFRRRIFTDASWRQQLKLLSWCRQGSKGVCMAQSHLDLHRQQNLQQHQDGQQLLRRQCHQNRWQLLIYNPYELLSLFPYLAV